jgi:transposase
VWTPIFSAVLAGEALGTPKSQTGTVEAIRLLRIARRSAMKARTQASNQIHAVITAPEQLRRRFVGRATTAIVTAAALFRRRHRPDTPLPRSRRQCERSMVSAPRSPQRCSPRPATTPSGSHHRQSFAALRSVSPIDASSGRQRHHRLNRYGDRHADWALHVIIISRLRWHPPTQACMARRLAEGRSEKMVIRCLKRHLVREVHRAITTDLAPPRHTDRAPAQAA